MTWDARRQLLPGPPTPQPTPPLTGVPETSLHPSVPGATKKARGKNLLTLRNLDFYHSVYTAYVNGDFERAIGGFQKFLDTYPQSKLADISQFWIAESFFSLGEYETANQEYDRLLQKYPNSDKVPAAVFGKLMPI